MSVLQLSCKSCGKPVPAEDVNIDKALAKCRACHAVFGFADLVGGSAAGRADEPVPMPKCFVVDNWGPELSLTRRWYSHVLWIMVPFCILWDGFLIVWFSASFGVIFGQPDAWMAGLFMLLFSVLHVAVGVAITYATLCGFVNRTVLRVSAGELTVWHGPLPFPGNRQILTADIKQLYCTETVHRGKRSCRTSYNVLVVTKDNDKITLVSNLDELEQGLFIEQQVEQHLRIRDQRVPGQVRI
jgi:hypothetical protein